MDPSNRKPKRAGQLPLFDNHTALNRSDFSTAAITFIAALVVYILTMAPTITAEDAGELVAASYTLGIPHPPGYPLWCLLGKLFAFIPLGPVAWRFNFMSAFWGAAAVCIMYLLIIRLTRNRIAAIAGALALAFSKEFWAQSVVAEVYTLNALLITLCVLLLFQWYETRADSTLYAFAIFYGLGLCNHHIMFLIGLVFLGFVLFVDRRPWRRWKTYGVCVGLSAFALSIYLYLPIRSLADPPMDWGNPENWRDFWDVVTRKQYMFCYSISPRSPARFAHQTFAYVNHYLPQFTPWFCWVPALGIAAMWKKDKLSCAFLVALFIFSSLGLVLILNFDINKEYVWQNRAFWIPSYVVAAILLGVGIDRIGSMSIKGRKLDHLALILAVGAAVSPLAANYHNNDWSEYYFAQDIARNILRTLDQNAIYLPSTDHTTFPVIYLHTVEGCRPDITIGSKYGYPEEDLYQDMPREMRRKFRKMPTRSEGNVIEDWIIAHTDRPVYFTKKRLVNVPEAHIADAGLLYRVTRTDEPPPRRDYWKEYEWHTLDPKDTRGDLSAEYILMHYYFCRGRDYLAEGEEKQGIEMFEIVLRLAAREDKEVINNIGTVCAEHRFLDAAANYYERALNVDPDYGLAIQNIGKVYFQKKQYDKALEFFDKARSHYPQDYETDLLAAQCLTHLERVDEALERLLRLTRLAPDDARVYRRIGMIYLRQKGNEQLARQMFSKSLSLDPDQPDLDRFLHSRSGYSRNRPTDGVEHKPPFRVRQTP